ncbi:hypothetical protein KLF32_06130 [Clostridium perfringens]|uniref:hypothetical protein n=1 Tax=Clostridium perfringens TaxID=1502 RepID=UPI001A33E7FB|nr:hypothetical protein [Clostridium perfringens]ELC8344103.1 hypothetical protein [Clostridium perfringens]MDK0798182.1 hypothetical protein [Clostridium perfringens]MDM0489919.1 hypothetical protein [Clostridium perfringens]MDM0589175.1 hypothetical protein [Clostridium perfringens]MDM0714365.1 hypothetical protein [Clostridium perfringens]
MAFIGKEFKERMNLLELSVEDLSDESFIDVEDIENIINNKVSFSEIDEFDLGLLCSVLHCNSEYFINKKVREKDLLIGSLNRGKDNLESKKAKAKIQDFINDFDFVSKIMETI